MRQTVVSSSLLVTKYSIAMQDLYSFLEPYADDICRVTVVSEEPPHSQQDAEHFLGNYKTCIIDFTSKVYLLVFPLAGDLFSSLPWCVCVWCFLFHAGNNAILLHSLQRPSFSFFSCINTPLRYSPSRQSISGIWSIGHEGRPAAPTHQRTEQLLPAPRHPHESAAAHVCCVHPPPRPRSVGGPHPGTGAGTGRCGGCLLLLLLLRGGGGGGGTELS
jgi:hypothetical protein